MTNIAPRQGRGLHDYLLRESRSLLFKGYSPELAFEQLILATKDSGRTTQDIEGEIHNAIDGAVEYLKEHPNFTPNNGQRPPPARRDPNAILDKGNKTDSRKARLPVDYALQAKIIAKEDTFIVLGEGVSNFNYGLLFANINFFIAACFEVGKVYSVQSLEKWKYRTSFPKLGFIVPSYFTESGCTRADLNVGERLYVVVEFDSGTPSDQICLHHYLNRTNPAFPLVMLVWSGHRSIHGWYATYGNSEHRVRTFQRRASTIGADQTCASPSAWIRMPNGYNYKHSTRQEVLYFDAEKVDWQNELVRREIL